MYSLLAVAEEHEPLMQIMLSFINEWNIASWIQLGLFVVCVLGGILIIVRSSIRRHIIRHLMLYACVVFGVGFLLYLIGFNWEGSRLNAVALVFRSITASMEMFVSESELIEVAKGAKENPWYMSMFAVTHFCAICISAAFILHILGIRFRSYIKMRMARKQEKDVYVFFDLSRESVALAKDIYRTREKDKNYQIVFVKTPMEESHLERYSFSHILSFADNKNEAIEELIDINAFLTYSRKSITIGLDEKEWTDAVGLSLLRRYIKRCSGTRHFFCLSPNDDNNINTAVALNKRYPEAQVYCRAKNNSITDSFSNPNLKFIDSSNLAVMELKKKVAYQPVSFVKPDTKKGVATKPFRSIIIGFGETGTEIFRFLYEFSSFVGQDSEENPFYCDIIDPKVDFLKNRLYQHCPALEEVESKTRTISFHNGTIESNRRIIKDLIESVDYIVVSTDNENENLSIGITLLDLAYKYRHYSNKLTIFVGVNDNREYKKAQEIAEFYNRCGQRDGQNNLYEFSLVPFGANEQLFTYKNIICDDILNKAKAFYYEYQKTAVLLDTEYEGKLSDSPEDEWRNRETNKKKDISGSAGLYYKNELQQKESQDIANVWHIKTKLYLAGACDYCEDDHHKCPSNDRHKQLFECISTVMNRLLAKMKEARGKNEKFTKSHQFILEQITAYEKEHNVPLGEYKTLFENLAKCEHLRWTASNRLLGYRLFENTNENEKHYLQKKHSCMVSNEELVTKEKLRDTIKYDYNTILVSMREMNNQFFSILRS